MQRKFLIALLALSLTGCIAQSRIQSRYMEAQDNCRTQAEQRVPAARDTLNANGAPDDLTSALARQFSECMNKAGWHVAAPKGSGPPISQNGPPATLPVMPALAPARSLPPPSSPAAAVSNGATPAAPILGPGVQPNPPAATAPVQRAAPLTAMPPSYVPPQAPATYQPGRPDNDDSGYGAGAGRQF